MPVRDPPRRRGRGGGASGGLLLVFASALHRDARAPVNLTPIAGLERHLHRLQGDGARGGARTQPRRPSGMIDAERDNPPQSRSTTADTADAPRGSPGVRPR